MQSPRLAIATSQSAPALNADDVPTAEHLKARGVVVSAAPWSDRAVDWSRFDAVLIRSTWDYHTRYAEFVAWLDRLEQLGVRTINPIALLRWNSDKRYLAQLPARDIDIVPTQIASGAELESVIEPLRGEDVVVKPAVSAGAWLTVRGRVGSGEFSQAIAAMPVDLIYLVQPFVAEIASDGEWSLIFFDGVFSHALLKCPASGDFRVQSELGGSWEYADAGASMIRAAQRSIVAAEALGHARATYARVDGVRSGGRFLIMEVEMVEPSLFLVGAEDASERFTEAVLRAL